MLLNKAIVDSYEYLPKKLIGEEIRKVSYFELDYGVASYDCGYYDSLDFGLQFDMTSGNSYYMIWDKQYIEFDLKFSIGHLKGELKVEKNIICHDATATNRWVGLVGCEIKQVKSYWDFEVHSRVHFPIALEFFFANQFSLVVAAADISSEGYITVADSISVFSKKSINMFEYMNA